MGSIFGISDLPVSTITTAVQIGGGMDVPAPVEFKEVPNGIKPVLERTPDSDKFVSKQVAHGSSNPVVKMRNGFGKLMKHFSKVPKKIK